LSGNKLVVSLIAKIINDNIIVHIISDNKFDDAFYILGNVANTPR